MALAVSGGRLCTPMWKNVRRNGTVHSMETGHVAHLFEHMQSQTCIDVVVIRDRDQRVHCEPAFDLLLLEVQGLTGRERRRPPGAFQIEFPPFHGAVFGLLLPDRAGKPGCIRSGPPDEIQRLARMQSMTVERHSRSKLRNGILLPEIVNARLAQAASFEVLKANRTGGVSAFGSASNVNRRNDFAWYSNRSGGVCSAFA